MATSRAEQQLILLSAGTASRRLAESGRADRLAEEVDWSGLVRTLHERRLLPTLGPRIAELGEGTAGEDFRTAVNEAVATGRRHGAFLQLVSLRAIAMLADAGIRAAALKGPLLGEAIYGDPGRRLSSDIDLLVSPDQLQASVEVLAGLGYDRPSDYVDEQGLPSLHLMMLHDRGELPAVELHWRVHWYERDFARERLLPPDLDPLGQWRPAAVDELAALLLFYARDGFVGLRLATDLSAWWDARGGELPAHALEEILSSYPALARALITAVNVAEKVVGLPAAEIFAERSRLLLRERMVVRLANPNPELSRSQLYADAGLVDGLLSPSGGLGAFVRRQILPPREVLDQQAKHAGRQRARSPLGRTLGVLARYAKAVARLSRASATLS